MAQASFEPGTSRSRVLRFAVAPLDKKERGDGNGIESEGLYS